MKSYRLYIILLILASAFFIFTQARREEEVDWSPSFVGSSKAPYGGYILRDLVPTIFPKSRVVESTTPIYNMIREDEERTIYMIVNESFHPDDLDLQRILRFVEGGNTLFLASAQLGQSVKDSLGITISSNHGTGDTTRGTLVNPVLASSGGFSIRNGIADGTIPTFDTLTATVLGVNQEKEINFVRIRRGKGSVILNTEAFAFTNYNLLSEANLRYLTGVMSYLPDGRIIWDEYYKVGRSTGGDSPMRYIWRQKALTSAFYLALAAVLLFMIFMGRRRQRIIPIIAPPANTTLEFVETMGRLYYHTGDHRDLAEKRITYFLESLRSRYGVTTTHRNKEFVRIVAARSGVDPDTVQGLADYIDHILSLPGIDDTQLLMLNRLIEEFRVSSLR